MSRHLPNGAAAVQYSINELTSHGVIVDAGRWQGVPTEGKPDLMTLEILDLSFAFPMAYDMGHAQHELVPNLPWAEDHFQERVSRVPSNPGEQYKNWPWWNPVKMEVTAASVGYSQEGNVTVFPAIDHSAMSRDFKFDHTYQERFWPKYAGEGDEGPYRTYEGRDNHGIRYRYGDLDDVVNQLFNDPMGRQAYLPIFFPEDTGAVHGGRVPCTLGYHLLLRGGLLHCWYDIRSCDAVRHFRDDLYLATRLVQWVIAELVERELRSSREQVWVDVEPGTLFFKAHSFHVHMGDRHLLQP